MPSFVDVNNGNAADASSINQVVQALKGTAGQGIPLSPTAVNDPINFALAVKNNDAGASKAVVIYKADGTVLFQVDKNGVIASPDGVAGATQLATLTSTQTLTNKTLTAPTLTSPTITSPVISGGVFGAWTTFTPSFNQSVTVTTSINVGRYVQIGKLVIATVHVIASSGGTAANVITISGLPVVAITTAGSPGTGLYVRGGSINDTLVAYWNSTTAVQFASSRSTSDFEGKSPAVTITAGDELFCTLLYEAA